MSGLAAAHPFNPLKLLRLAVHLQADPAVVGCLFDFVWRDGLIPDNPSAWAGLLRELGISNPGEGVDEPAVKALLKSNTDRAIAAGVFGVPTISIGGRLFWGQDSTDMALDFMRDPKPFEADDQVIAALPAPNPRRRR